MKKIVSFGELMLRLKSPQKERFLQSPSFEAEFGGSEANVCVSLANFGKSVMFVSAFPKNILGLQAANSLKKFGVEVNGLYKDGRLGLYFLEDGACQRPSQVIYDRENSVFSLSLPNEFEWSSIFRDASWFHISGITPAISENAYLCAKKAIEEAKKNNLTVSLDLNYRKKLWKYGRECVSVMKDFASKVDVLIANEEDIQKCLGLELDDFVTPTESYKHLALKVKQNYPNLKYVAITLRHSYSADKNGWQAFLLGESGFYESCYYDINNIVERVGAGDSFAAALIYGLTEFSSEKNGEQKALDFASSASCLKHSIPGDFNLISKEEVFALMNGSSNGRIQR